MDVGGRFAQRGQAAVEAVAIAAVVALLLAATGAWLVRHAGPPARPPDVLDAVARPLARPEGATRLLAATAPPAPPIIGRDDEPIGRALRGLGSQALGGARIAVEVRLAFDQAFAERLRERGRELAGDPVAFLLDGPERSLLEPDEAARRALRNAGRLWRYARALRSMPAREAALRAAEDAGRLAADGVVEAGRAYVRTRVSGRRAPAPPPPPAPRPPAQRGARTP
jgi:hypothetical protein